VGLPFVPATLVVGTAGLIVALLMRRHRPLSSWRVSSLIRASRLSYAQKEHDQSLSTALVAKCLAASTLGETSSLHESALFHLAAVHAAMRQHAEALSVLQECDALACAIHGEMSVKRVPICHALAEVFESQGKPAYREAVRALRTVRELRLAALGDMHPLYASSCFDEAGLLIRFANETPVMTDRERGTLTGQAVQAAFEAHAAAGRAGEEEQGLEYLHTLLEAILKAGFPNRLGTLKQCADAIQKLRDAGAVLCTLTDDEQSSPAHEDDDGDESDSNNDASDGTGR